MTISPFMLAGVPHNSPTLFHRIRFSVGDPAVYLALPGNAGGLTATLIVRDIEVQRAREHARADHVHSPADFTPDAGLSGDRETATAQAAAECLRRTGVSRIRVDRSLPYIYAAMLCETGIEPVYDEQLGVLDRRRKSPEEIEHLRQAQRAAETLMLHACRTIARAEANGQGVLQHEGQLLTSER
ncbi:MAG: hypothetical protein MI741_07905, partial [Rhodospirillales bacterium]|nr:hypothetical protein [Rhodospirillales bacterium]